MTRREEEDGDCPGIVDFSGNGGKHALCKTRPQPAKLQWKIFVGILRSGIFIVFYYMSYLRAAAPAADPGKKKEVRSAAHIRMHVQHAERWCTQHWLPAEFG